MFSRHNRELCYTRNRMECKEISHLIKAYVRVIKRLSVITKLGPLWQRYLVDRNSVLD